MTDTSKFSEKLSQINQAIQKLDPEIVMNMHTWMNDSNELESDFIKMQINAGDLARYVKLAQLAYDNDLSGAEIECYYEHAQGRHDLKRLMVIPCGSEVYVQINGFYKDTDQLQQTHEIALGDLVEKVRQTQSEGKTEVLLYGPSKEDACLDEVNEAFGASETETFVDRLSTARDI